MFLTNSSCVTEEHAWESTVHVWQFPLRWSSLSRSRRHSQQLIRDVHAWDHRDLPVRSELPERHQLSDIVIILIAVISLILCYQWRHAEFSITFCEANSSQSWLKTMILLFRLICMRKIILGRLISLLSEISLKRIRQCLHEANFGSHACHHLRSLHTTILAYRILLFHDFIMLVKYNN
jgi:hypothetical protein